MMSMGVKAYAQRCPDVHAPASFIWCHTCDAEMLIKLRTKGRATPFAQKWQLNPALPNQSQGANGNTQKCHK